MQQQKAPEGEGNTKVYVTGLKQSMHEKDLAEMFTKFGDIVNIIYKGCYAFIEFADVDCAEECVREMSKEKESDLQVQMAFNRSVG